MCIIRIMYNLLLGLRLRFESHIPVNVVYQIDNVCSLNMNIFLTNDPFEEYLEHKHEWNQTQAQ